VLGVHRGPRRLLVLADAARWIHDWFEGLGVQGPSMIVCWWHLVKRIQQDLSRACRGREHCRAVESAVLGRCGRGGSKKPWRCCDPGRGRGRMGRRWRN
jgi:hypothetical protein